MEAKIEANRREFQAQLKEVVARDEHGRGTGTGATAAKPAKFDGTTSWAMFRLYFEAVTEQNCRTRPEKYTQLIIDLQGRDSDVLHRVPKGRTYVETLEDRFGDQHLAAAYRSQLKTKDRLSENPYKNSPQPSSSWLTAPTPRTT
jgi:hypothetical protein